MAARGQRKSRCPNPASTVARLGTVVDRDLVDLFAEAFAQQRPRREVRGIVKPGREFGLNEQASSVCDFKNLRRFDDGAGICRGDRIAAGTLDRVAYEMLLLHMRLWWNTHFGGNNLSLDTQVRPIT